MTAPLHPTPPDDLTKAAGGDLEALARILPVVYQRAHEIAHRVLTGDRAKRWVQASSLVQQAVLRLLDQRQIDFADAARVTAVLATIMRRTVVDIARRETAQRRGGGAAGVSLHSDEVTRIDSLAPPRIDALDVEDSLVALAAVDPDAARVAELRLWGGMELDQIVLVTGFPLSRVKSLWNRAKAWLSRDLQDRSNDP